MFTSIRYAAACGLAITLLSGAAWARGVDEGTQGQTGLPSDPRYSQKDTTRFDELMRRTGVAKEVPGVYTLFIPSNQAFARLEESDYPCLRDAQCTEQVAAILRHHIIPSNVNLADATRGRGGVYAIDKTQINIAQPTKGQYYVNGKKVLKTYGGLAGTTYIIDGVIASPSEIAWLDALPTTVASDRTTTTESYTADTLNEPDHTTTTRTITKTTVAPAVEPAAGY